MRGGRSVELDAAGVLLRSPMMLLADILVVVVGRRLMRVGRRRRWLMGVSSDGEGRRRRDLQCLLSSKVFDACGELSLSRFTQHQSSNFQVQVPRGATAIA